MKCTLVPALNRTSIYFIGMSQMSGFFAYFTSQKLRKTQLEKTQDIVLTHLHVTKQNGMQNVWTVFDKVHS